MPRPENGVYIIQGEVNLVVTAMRRNSRWTSHNHQDDDQDPLLSSFSQLKDILNSIADLDDLAPNEFLSPFLDVIRSEDTTGPITGLALTSVSKFLSYGLIDPNCETAAAAIENIADAVTHARFVGTDPGSDEVVLMKILHVLRTLLLTPAGAQLTNESVCEIMQSCFRICFEMRLSELLRKSAEHTLMDMVQLLFSRLPQFKEDAKWVTTMKKLKMRAGGMDSSRGKKKRSPKPKHRRSHPQAQSSPQQSSTAASNTPTAPAPPSTPPTEPKQTHSTAEQQQPSPQIQEEVKTEEETTEPPQETPLEHPEPPTSLPTPPPSNLQSPEDDPLGGTTISTTPVCSGRTVVDIHEGFKADQVLRNSSEREDFDGLGEKEDSELSAEKEDRVCSIGNEDVDIIVVNVTEEKEDPETAGAVSEEEEEEITEEASEKEEVETITAAPTDGTGADEESPAVPAEETVSEAPNEQQSLQADQPELSEAAVEPAVEPAPTTMTLSVPAATLRAASSEPELDKASNASDLADDLELSVHSAAEHSDGASVNDAEYVNPRGVRFMPHQQAKDGSGPLIPYGLPCVRELFRFLVSLTNPLDRHNTDVMIHMGLSLLTVALESGADHIASFNSLLALVKDDCCKNLFFLLQSERLSLFAASIRVCFLTFESMRSHLKLQLEMYLIKLMDIIVSETPRISYEQREISLESVVQLMRIPGLVTELYVNYDCDLYCSNLFEDLMKLLSKNAFPVSGLFTTHLLSLDALLAVIDSIEQHCHHRILHTARLAEAESKAAEGQTPSNPEVKVNTEEINGEVEGSVPPIPPISGYAMATRMSAVMDADSEEKNKGKDNHRGPRIRPNRMKASVTVPSEEDLAAIKHKKKLYQTGTEQFNVKPSKGIAFLQEVGLLSVPLDAEEVVAFIKGNPKLDKNQIGEYVSNKKNYKVLEAFQRSFSFEGTRVDESLRMYLETFRLPGEAPVISYLLEHFAEHWHKTNGEPFVNADAAYTLAYAVIMLNVDQHNQNAKKQNIPMTTAEFKRNLTKVNGGQDFEQDMLDEIYHSIKSEEIIMPAEQVGLVRENYLWKVLLRRGVSLEGMFIHVPTGTYDRDLFSLVWGPTVAALSFVFDKSLDETIIHKAVSGFRKCAMISAHYGLSDVFDNLVISLCKFTTLLSAPESAELIPVYFGNNKKAQLAAKTVFGLAHRHGDILREGWKNILDCMLQLYRAKLMPDVLVTVEDFVDPDGRISLIREEVAATQKSESGMLSSIFSIYFTSETPQQRGPSPEDQEAIKRSKNCIDECHVEQLINESKFLMVDSLQELLKALIFASRCPEVQETMNGTTCDEDSTVFYLELLIHVVWVNRDRIAPFWQNISQHLHNLVVNATERTFLVERAVVGLLRLAIKLLRREEIASQVLESLQMLLLMKPEVIHSVSRQVAFALHNLLKTNAANIHSAQEWYTLFTLLEVVGAGANPPPLRQVNAGVDVQESMKDAGAASDGETVPGSPDSEDRGYKSDSDIEMTKNGEIDVKPVSNSWLLVYTERDEIEKSKEKKSKKPVNQFNIALHEKLQHHDTKSLMKSCETLAFLVRDAAHVTPHNFESCVHAIRTFVEASMNGGHALRQKSRPQHHELPRKGSGRKKTKGGMTNSPSEPMNLSGADREDSSGETDIYHSLSIQLLDLMHTLHTRAATIFSSWAEEEKQRQEEPREPYLEGLGPITAESGILWVKCWCPLLQGIARLCCDTRRGVRSQALTYLQRALLVHDLQTLSAVEWENCFNKVLFPLLTKLLEGINPQDPSGMEETRMRASTLLCKVFLQHLTPLLSLATFTALWVTILEFMDKYMRADRSDLLCEAIPENLKNMLLVMHTAGILYSSEGEQSQLWQVTWHCVSKILPTLWEEVFKPHEMAEPRRSAMRTELPQDQTSNHGESPSDSSPQQQQQSPAGSGCPSPVPDASEGPQLAEVHSRPESPLTSPDNVPTSAPYILHPPLASVATPTRASNSCGQPGVVPILLNPDIMQGTSIPIISPQSTPERKHEVATESH